MEDERKQFSGSGSDDFLPDLLSVAPAGEERLAELEADRLLGRDMLAGYVGPGGPGREDLERWEILEVERAFVAPVAVLDRSDEFPDGTLTAHPTAVHGGIRDLLIRDRRDGSLGIVDHKALAPGSISEDGANALFADDQISGYMLERLYAGVKIDWFGVNVLWKRGAPKPPRLVKPKTKKDACMCGRGEPHALSRAKDQDTTAALYRAAIVEHGLPEAEYVETLDAIALAERRRPRYSRFLATRTPEALCAHALSLSARLPLLADRSANWTASGERKCPRCPFRLPCMADTPEARSLFDLADNPNWESDALPEDLFAAARAEGKDVVTVSRMRAWQDCPRAHWFQYHEGLRPKSEARYFRFGRGIHAALAEWYRTAGQADVLEIWERWFEVEHAKATGEAPKRPGILSPAAAPASETLPF